MEHQRLILFTNTIKYAMNFRLARRQFALVLAIVLLASCAARKHVRPEHPSTSTAVAGRVKVGPFALLPGVKVVAFVPLPSEFETQLPPLWSQNDSSLYLFSPSASRLLALRFDLHKQTKRNSVSSLTLYHYDKPTKLDLGGLLDFAVSPDHGAVAIVAADPDADTTEIFVRKLKASAENRKIARFPGVAEAATVFWKDSKNLIVGLGPSLDLKSKVQNFNFAGLYRLNVEAPGDNSQIYPICASAFDFSRFVVSPSGKRILVSSANNGRAVVFDTDSFLCAETKLNSLSQLVFLGWSQAEDRILYATELSYRDLRFPGVFEYDFQKRSTRVVGAPTASATYTASDSIAIIGSRSLSAETLRRAAKRLLPAQIGLMSPSRDEITIFPTGAWTTPYLLLDASLTYAKNWDALVLQVPVPSTKGFMPTLISFPISSKLVELIGSGRENARLLFSWARSAPWLAVCDCERKSPTLLVVALPLK